MSQPVEPDPSEDDRLFRFFFGENTSPACGLPNLVLKNGRPSLPLILDTVGCAGGVWGMMPPLARDGTPYTGKDNHEYFRIWSARANQKWLRERDGIVSLSSFAMLLNVNVSEEFSNWIHDHSEKDYVPLLDDMLPLIVERIEAIRWAYFPLTDEYPITPFLTRPSDSRWVESLEEAVRRSGGPCCRISSAGGRSMWALPNDLKSLFKR